VFLGATGNCEGPHGAMQAVNAQNKIQGAERGHKGPKGAARGHGRRQEAKSIHEWPWGSKDLREPHRAMRGCKRIGGPEGLRADHGSMATHPSI
jgi:hypothetical protein